MAAPRMQVRLRCDRTITKDFETRATWFVRSHAALIFAKWAGEVEWR